LSKRFRYSSGLGLVGRYTLDRLETLNIALKTIVNPLLFVPELFQVLFVTIDRGLRVSEVVDAGRLVADGTAALNSLDWPLALRGVIGP